MLTVLAFPALILPVLILPGEIHPIIVQSWYSLYCNTP
jgi:hypothetical protein